MKSYEWDVVSKSFTEVDDPVYNPDIDDFQEAVHKARYFAQFSSEGEHNEGASITVYSTDAENKPRFYIDVVGQSEGIATLVARDFPSLVETLRRIHPLITLVGVDQFSTARIADHLDKSGRVGR